MLCSTHFHNTYIQILSEIGILGFLLVIFLFITVLKNNFVIILNKAKNNIDRSFYFIKFSYNHKFNAINSFWKFF